MMLAPALLVFIRIFRPIILALTAVATGVLRLLRITSVSEIGDVTDRDSVAALIGESSEEGLLMSDQQELLSGALAFEETTADTVRLRRWTRWSPSKPTSLRPISSNSSPPPDTHAFRSPQVNEPLGLS